jgi:zinc transport system substrate-binding protein
VWLDPVRMVTIVRTVERALAKADPKGRTAYVRNAQRVVGELEDLDARYRAGLADCQRTVVVTAHEAFGHLAKRYGLRQEGVAGLSPDAEPDARRIGELAALVRRLGVTTVFTEELLAPRLADALAREAGVGTDTLNPLEGLTDQELRRGDDYLSVMGHNLGKLEQALGCR